jgi:hypothetical protein
MTKWSEFSRREPAFAARVRSVFDAGTNKTMATLRSDGSPRISAIELTFATGEAAVGMMPGSVKLRDVRRDARVAIHSPTLEPRPGEASDAKLAGRLVEVPAPDDSGDAAAGYFELDIDEAVYTWVDVDAGVLVIEAWHPDSGLTELRR